MLVTNRLLLRTFSLDDFSAVHSYASRIENVKYILWGPNTKQETQDFLNMAIEKANESPCTDFHFGAVLKETNQLIGACSLTISSNQAEIGWIIHLDYWNQGYATEMAQALLRFGFEKYQLKRINAHCDANNISSYRVMERIGMHRDAYDTKVRFSNGKSHISFRNELSYSVTKKEWQTQIELNDYKT